MTRRLQNDNGEWFTLFYTIASPFSNHHPCEFNAKDIDDVLQTFNCTEQYYMYYKAAVFGDIMLAKRILRERNPKAMKSMGKGVRDFSQKDWDERAPEIMRNALTAKFGQNKQLRWYLFLTQGSTLVEAAAGDRNWGIGLSMDSPDAIWPTRWRGQNKLGKIMQDVREKLLKDKKLAEERKEALAVIDRDPGAVFDDLPRDPAGSTPAQGNKRRMFDSDPRDDAKRQKRMDEFLTPTSRNGLERGMPATEPPPRRQRQVEEYTPRNHLRITFESSPVASKDVDERAGNGHGRGNRDGGAPFIPSLFSPNLGGGPGGRGGIKFDLSSKGPFGRAGPPPPFISPPSQQPPFDMSLPPPGFDPSRPPPFPNGPSPPSAHPPPPPGLIFPPGYIPKGGGAAPLPPPPGVPPPPPVPPPLPPPGELGVIPLPPSDGFGESWRKTAAPVPPPPVPPPPSAIPTTSTGASPSVSTPSTRIEIQAGVVTQSGRRRRLTEDSDDEPADTAPKPVRAIGGKIQIKLKQEATYKGPATELAISKDVASLRKRAQEQERAEEEMIVSHDPSTTMSEEVGGEKLPSNGEKIHIRSTDRKRLSLRARKESSPEEDETPVKKDEEMKAADFKSADRNGRMRSDEKEEKPRRESMAEMENKGRAEERTRPRKENSPSRDRRISLHDRRDSRGGARERSRSRERRVSPPRDRRDSRGAAMAGTRSRDRGRRSPSPRDRRGRRRTPSRERGERAGGREPSRGGDKDRDRRRSVSRDRKETAVRERSQSRQRSVSPPKEDSALPARYRISPSRVPIQKTPVKSEDALKAERKPILAPTPSASESEGESKKKKKKDKKKKDKKMKKAKKRKDEDKEGVPVKKEPEEKEDGELDDEPQANAAEIAKTPVKVEHKHHVEKDKEHGGHSSSRHPRIEAPPEEKKAERERRLAAAIRGGRVEKENEKNGHERKSDDRGREDTRREGKRKSITIHPEPPKSAEKERKGKEEEVKSETIPPPQKEHSRIEAPPPDEKIIAPTPPPKALSKTEQARVSAQRLLNKIYSKK